MTAKVSRPFAHTSDAHAGTLRLNFTEFFRRYSFTVSLDLEGNTVCVARNTDRGTLASAVAMEVAQAFLHQTKHHQLHFAREPFD